MNTRWLIPLALAALLAAVLMGCSTSDDKTGNVYPGRPEHVDGSPVPALNYTNPPTPWRSP